jgi:hypothetical protein
MKTQAPDPSLSVFSPAGPTPRLEGFPLLTPAVQRFLMILGPALFLFYVLQAISPTIRIEESQIGQPPWVTLDAVFEADPDYARGIGRILWGRMIPISAAKAVIAQTIYVLAGSFFFALWLGRGRRLSQLHHLVLALLLLGLAAFGASVGFLVWEDRDAAIRIINVFLTAVVRPWMAVLVCGAGLVLAGLLDRTLIRSADGRPAVR